MHYPFTPAQTSCLTQMHTHIYIYIYWFFTTHREIMSRHIHARIPHPSTSRQRLMQTHTYTFLLPDRRGDRKRKPQRHTHVPSSDTPTRNTTRSPRESPVNLMPQPSKLPATALQPVPRVVNTSLPLIQFPVNNSHHNNW